MKLKVNPYLSTVEQLVPRVLSMQNRNPMSSTYGCFDRNYWHFKTIIDFPCATYQQVVIGLSKLFSTNINCNSYYQHPTIGESVRSGILFWCKIQNRDGSVNEYYENDHSFCPTAYTTYAIAQSYYLIQNLFSESEKNLIVNSLLKGSRWLSKYENPDVQNQMIASMNALYWVYRITNDPVVHTGFNKRRKKILESQNKEGWFNENGSADIGYSFKDLDLFAAYLVETDDSEILSAAVRLMEFTNNFLHPDGTAGGDYGSRCTQHIFPFNLEYFTNKDIKVANQMLAWFMYNFDRNRIIHPNIIDDKYTLYFYFNSYIQALLIHNDKNKLIHDDNNKYLQSIIKRPTTKLFNNAGILRVQNDNVSAWFSARRNGVCRIFYDDKLVYADTGYLIRLSDNISCATQWEDKNARIEYKKNSQEFNIKTIGFAGKVDDSLPLRRWIIPFKLFCKTLLYSEIFAFWFATQLKNRKIQKKYKVPVKVTRCFSLRHDCIVINDLIEIVGSSSSIVQAKLVHDVTIIHSVSSRFFQNHYLSIKSIKPRLIDETPVRCSYEYIIPFNKK